MVQLELDGIFNPELTIAATIDGASVPSGVIPRIGEEYRLAGGGFGREIEHDGPFALAIASEIAALEVQAGDNGDTIVIGSEEYTILNISASRNGIATLRLEGPL